MTDVGMALVAALEKLPSLTGVTWRGADGALAGSIRLPAPLPTSRDVRVASHNFSRPVLWAIIASAGRDVAPMSADPAAREVALLPASVLTPHGVVHDLDGTRVQIVLEVREGVPIVPAPPIDELAATVAAARAAGPATLSQPGRFG